MILIGLIIIAIALMVLLMLEVSGIRQKLQVPKASRRPGRTAPRYRGGDIMNAPASRGVGRRAPGPARRLRRATGGDRPQADDRHDRNAIRWGRIG
jgi:hypothetical protein